jgi:hypothetical protein
MSIKDHVAKYSSGYIRGGLYATVAFLTAFNGEFGPLKSMTNQAISALTWAWWMLAWGNILLATAIVMRAFFDGTMERISAAPEPGDTTKTESTTTTLDPPKPTSPP